MTPPRSASTTYRQRYQIWQQFRGLLPASDYTTSWIADSEEFGGLVFCVGIHVRVPFKVGDDPVEIATKVLLLL